MNSGSDTPHPEFNRTSGQAYKGFERTAVLPEDPELTHTDPGTPMGAVSNTHLTLPTTPNV